MARGILGMCPPSSLVGAGADKSGKAKNDDDLSVIVQYRWFLAAINKTVRGE